MFGRFVIFETKRLSPVGMDSGKAWTRWTEDDSFKMGSFFACIALLRRRQTGFSCAAPFFSRALV